MPRSLPLLTYLSAYPLSGRESSGATEKSRREVDAGPDYQYSFSEHDFHDFMIFYEPDQDNF